MRISSGGSQAMPKERSMKNLCRLAVVLFAALAISAAASPAAVRKNVFWISLAGTASKHPSDVYFTANPGGHMKNVKWTNWGGSGRCRAGWFFDTTPSYPGKPNQNGPAKLVARKPVAHTRVRRQAGRKRGPCVQERQDQPVQRQGRARGRRRGLCRRCSDFQGDAG